jgi:hypothetical protein
MREDLNKYKIKKNNFKDKIKDWDYSSNKNQYFNFNNSQ